MGAGRIILLVLVWVVPIFLIVKEVLKTPEAQRKQVQLEIKSWPFRIMVFKYFGWLLLLSGVVAMNEKVRIAGVVIIIISWFFDGLAIWNSSMKKGMFLMSLAVVVGIIYSILAI